MFLQLYHIPVASNQSYNIQDNGVKLVDPRGEMLENSWEALATNLSNAETTGDLIQVVTNIISQQKIDISKPANVVYARDTRPSGPNLVAALEDGLRAMGTITRNEGIQTTPVLHYLVRCINSKGTKDDYGDPSEQGYYQKLGSAFRKLMVSLLLYNPTLTYSVDIFLFVRLGKRLHHLWLIVLMALAFLLPKRYQNMLDRFYRRYHTISPLTRQVP